MKILKVHFKNLNSLEGEWEIDFTDSSYVSNGIFLITGSTGAGKTTVLDAICLALYGATPRLDKITKSSNEIMSRQTGDCFAEVIFETLQGQFVCHFSQHRSRKKPGGELQPPKHEISDANTGKVLESKLKDVILLVEKKTGMDFDRFTRSILLAQGGFAAFLHATPDERAPILEQITGTGIYSRISIQVHEKKTQEHSKLNSLQLNLSGMKLLDRAEETELNFKLEEKNKIEVELVKKQDKINKTISHQKDLMIMQADLQRASTHVLEKREELVKNSVTKAEIEKRYHAAKQERKEGLILIKKVRSIDLQIFEKTKNMQNLSRTIEQDQKACEQIENNNNDILKNLLNTKKIIKNINQYFKENSNHSFLVENFTGIEQMCTVLSRNASKMNTISDQILESQSIKKTVFENYLIEKNKNDLLSQELKEKDKDKTALVKEIESRLKGKELSELRENLEYLHARESSLNKVFQIQEGIKKDQDITHNEEKFLKKIEKANHELDSTIKFQTKKKELYEKEVEHLEKQIKLLARVQDLEHERLLLKDGMPCPLCGSKNHPLIEELVLEKGEEESCLELEKIKLKSAVKNIEKFRTERAVKEAEAINATEKISELRNKIKNSQTECYLAFDKLKLEMPFTEINQTEISSIILNTQSEIKQKTDILKEIEKREDQLKELVKIFETKRDSQVSVLQQFQKAAIVKTEMEREIKRLLKEKNLVSGEVKSNREAVLKEIKIFGINSIRTDEISQILVSLKQMQDTFQENQTKRDLLEKEVTKMNSEFDSSQARIEEINKKSKTNLVYLKDLNEEFSLLHKEREYLFADKEPDIEEKNLDKKVDDFEKLYETVKSENEKIQHEINSATTQTEDLEKSISIIKGKLAGRKEKNLENRLKVLHISLKDLQQSMGSIKQQLKLNSEIKEQHKEQAELIEKQKKECNRWDVLHEIIGSADGKKFRNFAQGLTFELMISHANRQLISMTDRYLLVRDEVKPLELNVIDNYQAGEIRSAKNLSGGEGFIVSLSLALGLSRMVSRNISVDSLFLDEGFGTLDSDALETALEALSSLRQTGKIIGLISHVPALKERIGVQIQIEAKMGGRSIITGSGCTQL